LACICFVGFALFNIHLVSRIWLETNLLKALPLFLPFLAFLACLAN